MKRILLLIVALMLACSLASGQSILERLRQKGREVIENAVTGQNNNQQEQTEQEEAHQHAPAAAGAWTCPECGHTGNTGKFCEECGAKQPTGEAASWTCPECGTMNTGKFCNNCGAKKPEAGGAAPAKKQVESAYAKSDFVPGDEIFFEDTFENEQLGEFPSQWDLMDGYAETGSFAGRKVLAFTDDGEGTVIPLMKEPRAFLPDVFTLEFDFYLCEMSEGYEDDNTSYLSLTFANEEKVPWNSGECGEVDFHWRSDGSSTVYWWMSKPNPEDETTSGQKDMGLNDAYSDYNGKDNPLKPGEWNHFAFSFNQRAFKGYINGLRVINIPIALAPRCFWFKHGGRYKYSGVSNVRLAKGAVPLYDRLTSEGKIVTYAITFDTGKATIKPESFVEINRIAELMKKEASLNFEVQGHCDSTGSDAVNDPLSQKRAEAIVAALVEQGIDASRLTAVGKGSHVPIADNSTNAGRAQNRRVEFIKK